jgi:putative membrane protein
MLWIKACHIIAVVCWFAGLFYLPRLFVYHAASTDPKVCKQFKVMEWRLFYYITTPAAILTVIFGWWMIFLNYSHYEHLMWLHIKLCLVLVLLAFHGACWRWLHAFRNDTNKHSERFYRIANEVPTVLLIIITLLAVVQPTL